MRKATLTTFVLVAIALASPAAQVGALAGEPTAGAVTKWEYRVLTKDQVIDLGKKDLAAGLNSLGEESWELAAVESAYIFKRPRQVRNHEDLQRQVSIAESDVAVWKDRAVWSERMFKKGFMAENQVQVDRQRLQAAEMALDRARRELKAFPTRPK